ncbi:Homeobox protein MSX-1 [Amphibalanus amphitrite]|uniref:Homeobox protein MSX-1 n=1 Tax=Amphibalanus amphitrite TaxID=1232801 RepID=A0A6A4WN35_AMPAM|nr:homeobox protein MSX-1-like [Amphibalanus amphitrite]KAF0303371.1 Homeobox protein MSX-1 [Amphibalanus amphitrite]
MQASCDSPDRPTQLSYMEVLRYHELCQTLYGGQLWAAPWLPTPAPAGWGELGRPAAPATVCGSPPAVLPDCPPGDCSRRPAAQETNTGRVRSDFSIEGILSGRRRSATPPADDKEPEYDWLNCTRYKPPKLPRPKKEGVQKRRLGRNPRIPFSSHQIALLEHKFRHKQYLSSYDVTELASLLCLSQTRVKIWFQNRRARERRDHEARTRTALPVVSGAPAVPPSTPSPTVLHSVRSAFQPVLAAAETVTECHRSQERPRLELDMAQTRGD